MPFLGRHIFVASRLFLVVGLVASCSPYVYKNEVGTFKAGVDAASAFFEHERQAFALTQEAVVRANLLSKTPAERRIVLSRECIMLLSGLQKYTYGNPIPPELVAVIGQDVIDKADREKIDKYTLLLKSVTTKCEAKTRSNLPLTAGPQAEVQSQVLAAVRDYSAALVAIVDATDHDALAKGASKACGSAQKLTETVAATRDPPGTSTSEIGSAANAVCGLVAEIGTAFLDRERFKVLRQAVSEANDNLGIITDWLGANSRKIHVLLIRHQIELLQKRANATVGVTNDEAYLTAIKDVQIQDTAFRTLAEKDPKGIFDSMFEAHDKLKIAVNDPATQLTSVVAAVKTFYGKAKAANEAVDALPTAKK